MDGFHRSQPPTIGHCSCCATPGHDLQLVRDVHERGPPAGVLLALCSLLQLVRDVHERGPPPEHFAVKMDTAAFTHRSDADAVVHLQEKIFLEKVKRNESLNVEGLPRSEFQRLLRALPYFEVLQTITLIHFECSQEEAEAFAKVGF